MTAQPAGQPKAHPQHTAQAAWLWPLLPPAAQEVVLDAVSPPQHRSVRVRSQPAASLQTIHHAAEALLLQLATHEAMLAAAIRCVSGGCMCTSYGCTASCTASWPARCLRRASSHADCGRSEAHPISCSAAQQAGWPQAGQPLDGAAAGTWLGGTSSCKPQPCRRPSADSWRHARLQGCSAHHAQSFCGSPTAPDGSQFLTQVPTCAGRSSTRAPQSSGAAQKASVLIRAISTRASPFTPSTLR